MEGNLPDWEESAYVIEPVEESLAALADSSSSDRNRPQSTVTASIGRPTLKEPGGTKDLLSPIPSSSHRQPQRENAPDLRADYQRSLSHQRPTTQPRSQPQSQSQSMLDMEHARDLEHTLFACREFLLSAAERTKFLSELTHRVEEHVNAEGNLDAQSLKHLLAAALRYGGGLASSRRLSDCLPKEGRIVEDHNTELEESLRSMLKAITECMVTRNTTYLAQLKKCRELCNTATRSAVQAERQDAHSALQRLQLKLDADAELSKSELRRQADAHAAECSAFRSTILELRNEKTRIEGLLETAQVDKERAVASAIRDLKDELVAESRKHDRYRQDEATRVQQAVAKEVQVIKQQLVDQADTSTRHDEEIRSILTSEKDKLDGELGRARDQLVQALAQLTVEKEVSAARVAEARALGEREAQEARAESLRLQASLKAELARAIQQARQDDAKRIQEFEVVLAKEREAHATAFAMDAERTSERNRAEFRRLQASLEVRQQEDLAKLRHVHEQEVKRLLRENDRLQRVLSRGAGGGAPSQTYHAVDETTTRYSHHSPTRSPAKASPVPQPSASPVGREQHNIKERYQQQQQVFSEPTSASVDQTLDQSLLPEDGGNLGSSGSGSSSMVMAQALRGSLDPEPCPPPPPPITSATLNWGALNTSLLSQEGGSSHSSVPPLHRRVKYPIDPAELDAAMQQKGASIASKAREVGSYVTKLQSYLEALPESGRAYDSSSDREAGGEGEGDDGQSVDSLGQEQGKASRGHVPARDSSRDSLPSSFDLARAAEVDDTYHNDNDDDDDDENDPLRDLDSTLSLDQLAGLEGI